jgi:hypothetical protein
MHMRRVSPSWVAVALAGAALFVSLGGPAWAAGLLVGTKQLKNNAVTSRKIKNGNVRNRDYASNSIGAGKLRTASVTNTKLADASVTTGKLADASVSTGKLADASVTTGKLADAAVTTSKLADNAVTSAKVADNSLTATDVAPNTFLPFNGTANNANAVGGIPASQIAQASGKRVQVGKDFPQQNLATLPTGFLRADCPAGHPRVTYSNASTPVEYGETDINGPSTLHFTTQNNIGTNTDDSITATGSLLSVTQQVSSKSDPRTSTMWTTAHVEGIVCHFTVQTVSTG